MNETYLYPYSAKEARERNELSLWRESHRANIACRDAIEDTIRRSFDGMHLNEELPRAGADGIRLQAYCVGACQYFKRTQVGRAFQPRQ